MIHNQFNNCNNVNVTNIHVTQQAIEPSKDELFSLPAKQESKLDSVLAETLETTLTRAIPALFTEVLIPVAKIGCIILLKTANIIIVEVLAPACSGTLKGIVHVIRQHKQQQLQLQAKEEAKLLEAPQEDLTLFKTLSDGTEIYNTK